MAKKLYVSEEEKNLMKDMYQEGYSTIDIASKTGRGISTVDCILAKMGIKKSRTESREELGFLQTPNNKKMVYKATKMYIPELGKYMYDITYAKYPDGQSVFGMDTKGEMFRKEFREVI